jgi:two-component system CheB/CheR fusion protein
MAQKMGLAIIAEGVETKEQVEFLKENGCTGMQGYYFSKPLSAAKIPEFVKRFNHN